MIAIIDSGGANIASVMFALERCGANGTLTADPDVIISADKVILPGVGAAPAPCSGAVLGLCPSSGPGRVPALGPGRAPAVAQPVLRRRCGGRGGHDVALEAQEHVVVVAAHAVAVQRRRAARRRWLVRIRAFADPGSRRDLGPRPLRHPAGRNAARVLPRVPEAHARGPPGALLRPAARRRCAAWGRGPGRSSCWFLEASR